MATAAAHLICTDEIATPVCAIHEISTSTSSSSSVGSGALLLVLAPPLLGPAWSGWSAAAVSAAISSSSSSSRSAVRSTSPATTAAARAASAAIALCRALWMALSMSSSVPSASYNQCLCLSLPCFVHFMCVMLSLEVLIDAGLKHGGSILLHPFLYRNKSGQSKQKGKEYTT